MNILYHKTKDVSSLFLNIFEERLEGRTGFTEYLPIIQASGGYGMRTLDQDLVELVKPNFATNHLKTAKNHPKKANFCYP